MLMLPMLVLLVLVLLLVIVLFLMLLSATMNWPMLVFELHPELHPSAVDGIGIGIGICSGVGLCGGLSATESALIPELLLPNVVHVAAQPLGPDALMLVGEVEAEPCGCSG